MAIDGRAPQQALGRLDQALRRFHAIVLHQLDGPPGGKVAPGLVGGAQFERRDQLAIAFQLCLRQQSRLAVVGAVRVSMGCSVALMVGPRSFSVYTMSCKSLMLRAAGAARLLGPDLIAASSAQCLLLQGKILIAAGNPSISVECHGGVCLVKI